MRSYTVAVAPILCLEMRLEVITGAGILIQLSEEGPLKGNFTIFVPRRLQRALKIGDELILWAVPDEHAEGALEVVSIDRKVEDKLTRVWRRSPFWTHFVDARKNLSS